MEKTRKSGEDAKVKGEGKVGAAGKGKKYPWFFCFVLYFVLFFMFALSQFSGPDCLGTWNNLKKQDRVLTGNETLS